MLSHDPPLVQQSRAKKNRRGIFPRRRAATHHSSSTTTQKQGKPTTASSQWPTHKPFVPRRGGWARVAWDGALGGGYISGSGSVRNEGSGRDDFKPRAIHGTFTSWGLANCHTPLSRESTPPLLLHRVRPRQQDLARRSRHLPKARF